VKRAVEGRTAPMQAADSELDHVDQAAPSH
jgi:hypothetical protein